MFEDIIGKKASVPIDEIVEKCTTCAHAKVSGNNKPPIILCTIAAGVECANNKDDPFNKWKAKNV